MSLVAEGKLLVIVVGVCGYVRPWLDDEVLDVQLFATPS